MILKWSRSLEAEFRKILRKVRLKAVPLRESLVSDDHDLNRSFRWRTGLLAQVISSLTASLRFDGALNVNWVAISLYFFLVIIIFLTWDSRRPQNRHINGFVQSASKYQSTNIESRYQNIIIEMYSYCSLFARQVDNVHMCFLSKGSYSGFEHRPLQRWYFDLRTVCICFIISTCSIMMISW